MNSSFFPVEHLPGVHVAEKHPDKRLGNWERHAGNENRRKGWEWRVYVQIYLDTQERARIKRVEWRRYGGWNCIGKEDSPTSHGSLVARFFFEWKWRMKDEKRWEKMRMARGFVRFRNKISCIASFILDYPLKRIPTWIIRYDWLDNKELYVRHKL